MTAWNEKLLMMYDFSYSDSVRWFSQSVSTRATYLSRGERDSEVSEARDRHRGSCGQHEPAATYR